jgi:hypothetical protein
MNFMDFTNYDLMLTACQHHHDVTKHAAELHLLRGSPRHRGSEWRSLSPTHGRPDAG